MESFRFSFRWSTHTILIAIILVTQGCSKDDDVIPSNGNGGTIATKTIGISGGEISIDSFSITIPPGAFSEDNKLEVSISDMPQPFEDQEVTSLYQIKGIPEYFSEPLSIVLKYDGILEDESYLAHGWEHYLEESDTTVIYFDLIDCKDSTGYLVGKLQPQGQNDAAKAGSSNLKSWGDDIPYPVFRFFKGIDKFRKEYNPANSSFIIKYPTSFVLDPRFTNLPDYLEINYLVFQTIFESSKFENFHIPQRVNMYDVRNRSNRNDVFPCFYYAESFYTSPAKAFFEYKIYSNPVDGTTLNILMGRAFYKSFQKYVYKNQTGLDWFSNAAALWIEEKFFAPLGTIGDYVPEGLKGKELNPFSGWGMTNHEGMVPVVKYLIEKYGEKVIVDYHQKIMDGKSIYEALGMVIDEHLETWAPNFFRDYLGGNVYGVTGDVFVKGITEKNENDLPPSGNPELYPDKYNDLSAKIYRFNTKDILLHNNAKVTFSVLSEDVAPVYRNVLIFSLNRDNNKIEFLSGLPVATLEEVSGIKELQDQNKDILVVVVNSYKDVQKKDNQSNISLNVELNQTKQLTYKKFSISLRHINPTYKYHVGPDQKFLDRTLPINMPFSVLGKFTGNAFEAEWNDPSGSQKISGSVIAVIVEKDDGELVLFSYYIKSVVEDSQFQETRQMSGGNIRLKQRGFYEHYGTVEGFNIDNTALNLPMLVWTVNFFNDDKTLRDDSYKLKDIEFTSESELEVSFTAPD